MSGRSLVLYPYLLLFRKGLCVILGGEVESLPFSALTVLGRDVDAPREFGLAATLGFEFRLFGHEGKLPVTARISSYNDIE